MSNAIKVTKSQRELVTEVVKRIAFVKKKYKDYPEHVRHDIDMLCDSLNVLMETTLILSKVGEVARKKYEKAND